MGVTWCLPDVKSIVVFVNGESSENGYSWLSYFKENDSPRRKPKLLINFQKYFFHTALRNIMSRGAVRKNGVKEGNWGKQMFANLFRRICEQIELTFWS
jgi:hypothetical protein